MKTISAQDLVMGIVCLVAAIGLGLVLVIAFSVIP